MSFDPPALCGYSSTRQADLQDSSDLMVHPQDDGGVACVYLIIRLIRTSIHLLTQRTTRLTLIAFVNALPHRYRQMVANMVDYGIRSLEEVQVRSKLFTHEICGITRN